MTTTTTHKTLRGPRGGMILTNDEDIAKKINSAIFPGLQGGPLMHVIAGKAVAFKEALQPEFKAYAPAGRRQRPGAGRGRCSRAASTIVTGGTDNHLMLVDLRPKNADRQAHREGARARLHHQQQERRSNRSRKAGRHLGHPRRHAGRHLARLQGGRVQAGCRADGRSARRPA